MFDASHQMHTPLSLDDDVLNSARLLAARHAPEPVQACRSGLPVLPRRPDGVPVDLELVNQLRDEAI